MLRNWSVAAVVLLFLGTLPLGEASASGLTAKERRCAARQLTAAGQSISCRLKAHARSEKRGKGSAGKGSLAKCSDRLARAWDKIEPRCETGGDEEQLDALLDSVASTLAQTAHAGGPMPLEEVALCVGDNVLHTENGCQHILNAAFFSWAPPESTPGQPHGNEGQARSCASRKLRAAAAAGACLLRAEARALSSNRPPETGSCHDKLADRFVALKRVCGSVDEDQGPKAGQVQALMTSLQDTLSQAANQPTALADLPTESVCSGDGVAVVAGRCEAVSGTGNKNTVVLYDLIPDLKADADGAYSSLSYLSQVAEKPIDIVSSEVIWLASAADWPSDANGGQWGLSVSYEASCRSTKKGGCDPDYAARNQHGTCTKPKNWDPNSGAKCTEVSVPGETLSAVYSGDGQHFLPQVAMNTCWQALTQSVSPAAPSITLTEFWKSPYGQLCDDAQGEQALYDIAGDAIPNSTVFTYAMAQSWAKAAGEAVATVANGDKNAVGVSTDIEPPLKQPYRGMFHTSLASTLNAASRFHTMWTGPETIDLGDTNEIDMLKALSAYSGNYLTISLYDRGSNPPEPISPAMFASIFATQLGTGSCNDSDSQPENGSWPATPGSASSTPPGVDQGQVCGGITHSAWRTCEDGYGNPMLPCPGSPNGMLARFSDKGLTNPIQVGLPFKATTSEWLYRQGPDSSNYGDTTAGAYPECFRNNTEYYKTISSNGDIVIQNATASSMGDYVAPALDVISDLRTQGNASLVGIYAYGISPKKYLDETGDPFLDTIPTYVVDPDKIQQICSGAPITDIQNYSYGTASDITNQIDSDTWNALEQWNAAD